MPRLMLPAPARLARHADAALLLLRLAVGLRLVVGTLDNVLSWARMEEFAGFLEQHGFPLPIASAVVSVAAQFVGGLLIGAGLFTRPAAAVMVVNFAVALVMVHLGDPYEAQFPPLVIGLVCLYLAVHGPGRWALDAYRARRHA